MKLIVQFSSFALFCVCFQDFFTNFNEILHVLSTFVYTMLKLKLLEVQTHCLTSLKARGHVLFIKMTLFTMVTQWPPPLRLC